MSCVLRLSHQCRKPAAILVLVGRQLKRLPGSPPTPPLPPAEWNQDPSRGAVVVPGPPGGTDDQVQGG